VRDTAEESDELLQKIKQCRPDLVIADYYLPKNTRLFTFRRIQQEFDIPILMLIGRDELSDEFVYEAMGAGVSDFVKIPRKLLYPQFRAVKDEIVQKIWAVVHIKTYQRSPENYPDSPKFIPALIKRNKVKRPSAIVVIGASTGGTKAIEYILKGLKPATNAVYLIAVHLPAKFTKTFTQRIRQLTPFNVVEGKTGLRLLANKVIVAPGDRNMLVYSTMGVRANLLIDFDQEETNSYDRPSVDVLMQSLARVSGQNTLGVILTGMGNDGTVGARAILENGGETIAQDAASSVIFGMAKSAIENGGITKVLSLTQIPDYINRFTQYHQIQPQQLLYGYKA
jgi:two-component system chemotaxis response regulator CheB